ncbi:MAG: hypothetical protein FWB93_03370 [Oscillospiraceae bacterium]|nr:hypothetical protein [Oscillospiraceae bacterium]
MTIYAQSDNQGKTIVNIPNQVPWRISKSVDRERPNHYSVFVEFGSGWGSNCFTIRNSLCLEDASDLIEEIHSAFADETKTFDATLKPIFVEEKKKWWK